MTYGCLAKTLSSSMAVKDMSSNFSLNEEQQEIVNLVLEGHNVIICGQAGVGENSCNKCSV